MEDLGGLPGGGGNCSPFFSSKTNPWAAHEQVPFRDLKRPSAPVGIQMDPSFLLQTQVRFLGWGDPLEKETATHSSILAWKSPWMEEPGGLQSMGVAELDTTEAT